MNEGLLTGPRETIKLFKEPNQVYNPGLSGIKGDFNNDGKPDIFWRNDTTGANALWYMNPASSSIKGVSGAPSAGTAWEAGG